MHLKLWQLWLWLQRNSVWLIGLFIGVSGVLGMWKCPNDLGKRLSEALLIAGVLSVSVDIWLKRKLQEDAAKDLFRHLLGMSLPKELRFALQRFIEESVVYRKDVDIRVNVEDAGEKAILSIMFDAVNVGAKDCTYKQYLTLEEAFEGEFTYASLRTHRKSIYALKKAQLALKEKLPQEPMVWHWEGEGIPLGIDDELIQRSEFTVKRSRRDFYILFFGRPTINPRLIVTGSDSLNIYASVDGDTIINGNEYIYKRVFLRGDHIQVRWKPKDGNSKN